MIALGEEGDNGVITTLADAHRQISDLLHEMPTITAPDVARFGLALAAGTLVSEDTLAAMLVPRPTDGSETDGYGLGLNVGRHLGALEAFREVLEVEPDEADHHAYYGWTYFLAHNGNADAVELSQIHLVGAHHNLAAVRIGRQRKS